VKVVGCDWMIESTAREDQCGVCHGDGTTCTTVTQHFDTQLGVGYVEATIIPAGTVPQCAVRTRCAKKTGLFLRVDNFATVRGRKACDMSKVSQFYQENV